MMNYTTLSTILLKRAMLLNSVKSAVRCLTLRQIMFNPELHVKNRCQCGTAKMDLCKVSSHKEVLANGFYSKDGNSDSASQVTELLQHMQFDIKNFGRIKFKDAEILLNFIQKGLTDESDDYGLLLLKWCAQFMPDVNSSYKIIFFHSVWKTLQCQGIEFSTEHYNALLKCYAVNGQVVSVAKFLADMGLIEPNKSTYELLLECTCVIGDLEQATLVIHLMKEKNIPVSEATFNSLILGHARAGDIKSSLHTLDTMQAANLVPSTNTYTAVIQSYAEFGDFEQMKKTYSDAACKNIYLNDFQVMSICRILAIRAHHLCMSKFLALLPEDYKKFSPTVCNTVLELVHLRFEEAALLLVMSISPEVENTSEHPCAFFVHEMCRANAEPINIINICNRLEDEAIFPRALYKAAESSLQLAKPETTLLIFQALVKKGVVLRSHYFWPIFRQRAKQEGETGVVVTLKDMQALGLTPNFHTLLDYILPVISINDPEVTIKKLQMYGVSVRQSLTPVAAMLIFSGKLQRLLHLCEIYPTKVDFEELLQPLVESFVATKHAQPVVSLLKTFMKTASTDLAGHFLLELLTIKKTRYSDEDIMNILQSFKEEKIFISTFAAEVATQYFKNGGTTSKFHKKGIVLLESLTQPNLHISSPLTAHISHPRDMNLEELECHLVELKSKNMNTRGTLRRLLQLYIQKGNISRVLELKKELEDSGFEFSPGMKASLFALYIQLKQVTAAAKCLYELTLVSPSFVVDEHKIIDYATLLVTEKQYKAAVTILETRAVSKKIRGGESVSRNCWHLLNAIAMQGEPEKVKHMFHLLRTLGFCSVSNTLLGPLVRAYLKLGDTEGAVKEYLISTAEFQETPLQQELFTHLVEKSDDSPEKRSLLDDVMVATSSIHGESSTLVTYAVALAESDRKKELQNVIAESGFRLEYAVLINRARKLTKEGKLIPLSNLADACANLPHFDISLFYTLMLQIYDTRGDSDGAVQLWTVMQEKNIQPSQEFRRSFASILRSHNKTIPVLSENFQS